jgi:BatD DUF11 like domain
MVKKRYIFLAFCMMTSSLFGQSLISYVTVNPNSAYIGQPVELKVSVYTSTWFTKGIDVGNIQVDGALTVYFRSVSNSRMFDNKRYAGVDFYYNLFPTQEGIIEIPSLVIRVESPKDGDYKGIARTVKTKPKTLTVKNIPLGYDPHNWLVASSLNVKESWSASLKNIKVGDVLQRTISRSAGGTLAEFIPATNWDSIAGISIYPNRPKVNTNKSKTGVSASRTETVNYLFEKEGELIIPAIEYLYWNPRTKKFYKKYIDSLTIMVEPNADLAMLESIKKSLQNENSELTQEEEKPFLIFGLSPKTFAKYLIIGLLVLFVLIKILKVVFLILKNNYSSFLKSERFAFEQVKKAIRKNNYAEFVKSSNIWLSKISNQQFDLPQLAKESSTPNLKNVLNQLNETIFKQQKTASNDIYAILLSEIKNTRSNYFKQQKEKNKRSADTSWLNPTS